MFWWAIHFRRTLDYRIGQDCDEARFMKLLKVRHVPNKLHQFRHLKMVGLREVRIRAFRFQSFPSHLASFRKKLEIARNNHFLPKYRPFPRLKYNFHCSSTSDAHGEQEIDIRNGAIMAEKMASTSRKNNQNDDLSMVEFETSEDVEVVPTFQSMKLREELLRGIYAYGEMKDCNLDFHQT